LASTGELHLVFDLMTVGNEQLES